MPNYNSTHSGAEIDQAVTTANSLASWAKAANKPSYNAEEIEMTDWSGQSTVKQAVLTLKGTTEDHEGRISALETALEGVADRLAAI